MPATATVPRFDPDRLRSAREGKGWPRERLAVEADVPYGSLQRYETGATMDPPFNAMARLARALGIGLEQLAA